MTRLEELKQEANTLGIEFAKNIGADKLQERIDAFKEAQEDTSATAEDSIVKQVKAKEANDTVEVKSSGKFDIRSVAAKLKKENMATRVVKIVNNDQRDNHVTTTCYLSMECEHYGISRIVPLNTPIELEKGLIDVAKSIKIPLHVDEVVNGQRTGNKTYTMTNKYSISYEDVEK